MSFNSPGEQPPDHTIRDYVDDSVIDPLTMVSNTKVMADHSDGSPITMSMLNTNDGDDVVTTDRVHSSPPAFHSWLPAHCFATRNHRLRSARPIVRRKLEDPLEFLSVGKRFPLINSER